MKGPDSKKHDRSKKRVLIVGAGAAGMSCAHQLALQPDKYSVTLIDAASYCGGQAFSIPIDKEKYGASWLNQGVQGGSFIFHHTMTMFARLGFHADPVKLQVSFGKGDTFWTNVFPSILLANHQPEIRRFHRVLRLIRWFEILFLLLPIKAVLALFGFSRAFTNLVVCPMLALFLGTGNATPDVPAVMLDRLATSPTYGMWYPADPRSVASNLPPMVVFPNFSEFYEAWRLRLVEMGVKVRLATELTRVLERGAKGVRVALVQRTGEPDGHNRASAWASEDQTANADREAEELVEGYDELVLCTLADTSLRLLGRTATCLEKLVLGSAKFSDDLTITHTDSAYMQRHYEENYNPSLAVSHLSGIDQSARLTWAQRNFRPMYLIKPYFTPSSPSPSTEGKLEMCFNCSNYQAQFPPPGSLHPTSSKPLQPIYQTIFLNAARDRHLWTAADIDPARVLRKDWWHQLCHAYTHYLCVVPWVWLLQSGRRRRTRFAGAWTLVNAHEVAVMSGIAAAVELGAEYPRELAGDRWARVCFGLYRGLVYGRVGELGRGVWGLWRGEKEGEGERGWYGSVYDGEGVAKEERTMWREERVGGRSL